MDNSYLTELSQFEFPSIPPEKLCEEPYKFYTQIYIEASQGYNFFHGYIRPNEIQRAKIYRAIKFCSRTENSGQDLEKSQKEPFITFCSSEGLILKCRENFEPCGFDSYLKQSDDYIFIPPNCSNLDHFEYSYNRRLLTNFCTNDNVPGKIIANRERNTYFLFVALTKPLGKEYIRKWSEYTQGGILREYRFSEDKLMSVLKIFPWEVRESFSIKKSTHPEDQENLGIKKECSKEEIFEDSTKDELSEDSTEDELTREYFTDELSEDSTEDSTEDESIELSIWVRISSKNEFDRKCSEVGSGRLLKSIDLDNIIRNNCEVMGIIRLLADQWKVYPCIGTNRIYFKNKGDQDCTLQIINERLSKLHFLNFPETDEFETFTLQTFNQMTKYERYGCIRAPTNYWYSILDLYQHGKKEDPQINKKFSPEFIRELDSIFKCIPKAYRTGFPPTQFTPELSIVTSDSPKYVSFYVETLNVHKTVFWLIPDLRQTKYSQLALDAIQMIVTKWSDRSIFQGRTFYSDLHLIFCPKALYVIEQTFNSLTILDELDEDSLADFLRSQLQILSSI